MDGFWIFYSDKLPQAYFSVYVLLNKNGFHVGLYLGTHQFIV